MALSIEQRRVEPDIMVLELYGRFMAGRDNHALETATANLLTNHERKVILDLSGVDYMDSTGIGQISKCAGRLQDSGAEVRIAGAQGLVREVLAITRIDSVLGVSPSVAQAVTEFGGDALPRPPF